MYTPLLLIYLSYTRSEEGELAWGNEMCAVVAALPNLDSQSPFKSWTASDLLDEDGG